MAYLSLIPRPPPFFVLWFAFSVIYGSGSAAKNRRSSTSVKNKKRGRPGNEAYLSLFTAMKIQIIVYAWNYAIGYLVSKPGYWF